ncbi:MAG: uridylate kinase [Chloroflexi bacterium]|nr:uridylate kinase [Chloroflexota bacterium]
MTTLVFLKLGGSLLTDKTKPEAARPDQIRRCMLEIAGALRARPDLRLVLAHGSGSFGHVAAVRSRFGSGGATGYVETGAAAARLNRIVADIALDAGLPVAALQPAASAVCDDGRLVELATHPLEIALQYGLVPLVFGDVAFDLRRGGCIASTEMIFDFLARRLHPARILLVGQVNGVHTSDPLRDPTAQRIARVTPATLPAVRAMLGGSHGIDVTGGMLTKVALMAALVEAVPGARAQIISGETEGLLRQCLISDDNEEGTIISN